jgi:hypothetical protein
MESWIVRFDENGVCTSPKTRDALLAKLEAAPDRPIIFFSHGWNNDFSDATSLYSRFLKNFEEIAAPLPFAAKPIFVGLTWPSIWLASDPGPQLAATVAAQSAADEAVLAELRRRLPQETNWPRLYALLESDRVSENEAREIARLIAPALQAGEREGPKEDAATEDLVLQAMKRLQDAAAPPRAKGYNLGESGMIDGAGVTVGATPAGILDFLDPRNALRLASLYIMKDRAGVVGGAGVSELLRAMLSRSKAPVFLVGHSFGCKVMMSAVCAAPLSRKLEGVLLLQPAISYLCFASNIPGVGGPGGYRGALERVEKPILATYSGNDAPLHAIYHLALMRAKDIGEGPKAAAAATSAGAPPSIFAALGGYGPRDCGETLIDPMPDKGGAYTYPPAARVVGVDGTVGKRIDSHGGVTTPAAAWALRKLMD